MNLWRRFGITALTGLLFAVSTLNLRAIPAGEAAALAGIAAGTAVAVPLLSTALTRSGVQVEVELYQETIRLPVPFDMRGVSPDQLRSAPFRLGTNVALNRIRPDSGLTPALALQIADQLAPFESQFAQDQACAKKTGNTPAIDSKTREYFLTLEAWSANMSELIKAYRNSVKSTIARGAISEMQLTVVSNRLASVREGLRVLPQAMPTEGLGLLRLQVIGMFRESWKNPPTVGAGNVPPELPEAALTKLGPTNPSSVAAVLFPALQFQNEIRSQKGDFRVQGQPIGQFDVEKSEKYLQELLNAFCINKTVQELATYNSEASLAGWLNTVWLPQLLVSEANRALGMTYVGVSVGANFGPILQEVIQGIFSPGQILDEVTSNESKWKRFNYVKSAAGAGDHSAVIYFDNALTPVLKTASFDPSEFIAANAQVYKRVALTAASIYGVPVAGGTGTAGATGAVDPNPYNLLSAQSSTVESHRQAAQRRAAMIDTLSALIELNRKLQNVTTNSLWVGADANAQAQTRTNFINTVTTTLQQLTQELQASGLNP